MKKNRINNKKWKVLMIFYIDKPEVQRRKVSLISKNKHSVEIEVKRRAKSWAGKMRKKHKVDIGTVKYSLICENSYEFSRVRIPYDLI